MVMYFDPLKVLMPVALWLLAIGAVKAVVDMIRHPFYFPANTVLLVMAALLIGSMALLADLIVRSRGDDTADPGLQVISTPSWGPVMPGPMPGPMPPAAPFPSGPPPPSSS
jgi:hypothetical protein